VEFLSILLSIYLSTSIYNIYRASAGSTGTQVLVLVVLVLVHITSSLSLAKHAIQPNGA